MNGGMFPWMMGGMSNTNNDIQRGFDQSAIINGITGVQNAVTTGFGNVQTALCNGFAGVANGFSQEEQAAIAARDLVCGVFDWADTDTDCIAGTQNVSGALL